MTTTTEHCHIVRVEGTSGGEPIVKGTRTPVRSIVLLWRQGMSPEEIRQGLPHLTMAQVFDALSYFSDHPDEIEGYIEKHRVPEELIHPLVKGR